WRPAGDRGIIDGDSAAVHASRRAAGRGLRHRPVGYSLRLENSVAQRSRHGRWNTAHRSVHRAVRRCVVRVLTAAVAASHRAEVPPAGQVARFGLRDYGYVTMAYTPKTVPAGVFK